MKILTVEIEHVNVDVLEELQNSGSVLVHPGLSTIRIIQDKFLQKQHLSHDIPVAESVPVVSSIEVINTTIGNFGLLLVLKTRMLAYDSRGNSVVRAESGAQKAITYLGDRPLFAEHWVPFAKEIAVMVARTTSGEVKSYPVMETVHKHKICHVVFAPLRSQGATLSTRARAVAEKAVKSLDGAGVFDVDMFLLDNGEILVNEIAPRPHKCGHYTIEPCETSQYENHLRAILSLPLGSTDLKVPFAAMLNVLGASPDLSEIIAFTHFALTVPGASVHLYGIRLPQGRKMGHITLVTESDAQLRERLCPLFERIHGGSSAEELTLYVPAPREGHSHAQLLVGIIMGSESDLPVMLPAAHILDRFRIPCELMIVSTHRMPDRLIDYARAAAARPADDSRGRGGCGASTGHGRGDDRAAYC